MKLPRILSRFKRAIWLSNLDLRSMIQWSFQRTEFSNFYYKISDRNIQHINSTLALISGTDYSKVECFTMEILSNSELQNLFEDFVKQNPNMRDSKLEFGRRIFWYGLIRITKPRVVVETGISHGVGSCLIAQALIENQKEGYSGVAIGTEIDENCGKLIVSPWKAHYKVIIGDSISTLEKISQEIDIFISDSNHDSLYEYNEYVTVFEKLSENGILVADNAHASDSMIEFSKSKQRKFLFIKEEPLNHWYPGSGIGVSINKVPLVSFQN